MTTPTLETKRFVLRRFEPGDADFIFDMHSRHEVRRYIGSGRVMVERQEAVERIVEYSAFDQPGCGIWLVIDRATAQRLGTALVNPLPASSPDGSLSPSGEIEIGWHLHPDAWGRGVATESARRVLNYAFEAGHPHILAVTNPANTASQAVARRIGMRALGVTDAYYDTMCALFRIDRKDAAPL